MLNQVIMVARCSKIENNNDVTTLEVKVQRTFKNDNGEYDVDTISCNLIGHLASNTKEFLEVGNLIGIKGHLEECNGILTVIAEKITLLSSKKEEDK